MRLKWGWVIVIRFWFWGRYSRFGTCNALGNQSDSDEEENLSLQEPVKKKEEKEDDTGTDNEKDDDENPTQTPAAPTVPIYKWTSDTSINRLLNLKWHQTHMRFDTLPILQTFHHRQNARRNCLWDKPIPYPKPWRSLETAIFWARAREV